MRITLVLLKFVICFLAGTLYGTSFEKSAREDHTIEKQVIEVNDLEYEPVEEGPVYEQAEKKEVIPAHTGNTPAFQAASALESIVNFFYDMIVDILYHASKVFY